MRLKATNRLTWISRASDEDQRAGLTLCFFFTHDMEKSKHSIFDRKDAT